MNKFDQHIKSGMETKLACERPRLVRLCAKITGDSNAAEDLAQETLIEAWRHLHDLREQERFPQWLSGIAYNVCRRWARKRGRDLLWLAEQLPDAGATSSDQEDTLADDFDIEVELEHKELITILDRALALLTPEARALLIERYVEESPIAEVAERMGVHASVVAMRLQRGKIALRRVLTTELRQELAPYRMGSMEGAAWEQTRLWCMYCGRRKLLARSIPGNNELWIRCPACCPTTEHFLVYTQSASLLGDVKGYRRAFSRIYSWVNNYYRPHLLERVVLCSCGQMTPLRAGRLAGERSLPADKHSMHYHCEACGMRGSEALESLAFALPETQKFYQQHQRIRFLPEYGLEVDGQAAIVTSFESVASQDRIVIISAADTYGVLRCYSNRS